MDVYRKKPVPVIYTELCFVRAARGLLADCPGDISLLKQIQNIAAGQACVSELEGAYQYIIKAEFQDDIRTLTGNSGRVINWKFYHWKFWDVTTLVSGNRPTEAVALTQAGIEYQFLDSLAHPTSCLPLLSETERALTAGEYRGFTLHSNVAQQLEEHEKSLIARVKLAAMKQLEPLSRIRTLKQAADPTISATLRDEVLRRDNYRCVFCGQDASSTALEVNHIIPRSLIRKLHLEAALHTAPENLCVTCFRCNRAKSDHLAKEDIAYYTGKFSDVGHHNHGVLQHLDLIAKLQMLSKAGGGESGAKAAGLCDPP